MHPCTPHSHNFQMMLRAARIHSRHVVVCPNLHCTPCSTESHGKHTYASCSAVHPWSSTPTPLLLPGPQMYDNYAHHAPPPMHGSMHTSTAGLDPPDPQPFVVNICRAATFCCTSRTYCATFQFIAMPLTGVAREGEGAEFEVAASAPILEQWAQTHRTELLQIKCRYVLLPLHPCPHHNTSWCIAFRVHRVPVCVRGCICGCMRMHGHAHPNLPRAWVFVCLYACMHPRVHVSVGFCACHRCPCASSLPPLHFSRQP